MAQALSSWLHEKLSRRRSRAIAWPDTERKGRRSSTPSSRPEQVLAMRAEVVRRYNSAPEPDSELAHYSYRGESEKSDDAIDELPSGGSRASSPRILPLRSPKDKLLHCGEKVAPCTPPRTEYEPHATLEPNASRKSAAPSGTDVAAPTLVKTREVIEAYIAQGLCVGAQVSTKVEGKEQHDLVVGEVRENVPMQKDVLMHMMSITKVVGVVAIGQLLDRKLITINDRVAKHIPEFGKFGKELIRIEHLLTHTAGIPYADTAMWTKLHMTDEVLRVIYDSKLEHGWQPGRKAGYHAYSAWFLLGEIVRRVDGRPFEQYAMEEIFKPLGMTDTHVGMSHEQFIKYSDAGLIAELWTRNAQGATVGTASTFTSEAEVTGCVPGANGRGPACQWLRLFEMLLREGVGRDGVRLLNASTVKKLTRRFRVGMYDIVQGIQCDWTLGLFVGSSVVGPHASPDSYGHGGSQSSLGWCDSLHKLSAVIVCNTRPGPKIHHERAVRIATAIYEDLGLAGNGNDSVTKQQE